MFGPCEREVTEVHPVDTKKFVDHRIQLDLMLIDSDYQPMKAISQAAKGLYGVRSLRPVAMPEFSLRV